MLFEVTGSASWSRRGHSVEPISGQKVAGATIHMGSIPICQEPLRRYHDEFRGDVRVYRFITNRNVTLGDIVDGKRVSHIESVMGLTYGETT